MDRTEIQTEPRIETPAAEAVGNLLDGWMSRAELAAELGVCVDTLMRWERRRYGPKCVKAGRKALYKRSTVLAWLEAQESAAPEIEAPRTKRRSVKAARPARTPRIGGRAA
jgi:transcriptional regulator with XRE-family HTH domain